MKIRSHLLLVTLSGFALWACQPAQTKQESDSVSGYIKQMNMLMGNDLPKPKLMMLGTFHFADAGLDDYKPKHSVDILSEERQAQVQELVDFLARYQPTKIAIEYRPDRQTYFDSLYQEYRSGGLRDKKLETIQIAFRLANQLGHEKLYCVDAARQHYPYLLENFDYNVYTDTVSRPSRYYEGYNERYTRMYEFEDSLKTLTDLKTYFLYKNSPERINMSHGNYLLSTTAMGIPGDYIAPDLQTSWYNRNLRIYSNIAKLIERPDERILLLIGAGHLPILRHAVEASPALELVEVATYLD